MALEGSSPSSLSVHIPTLSQPAHTGPRALLLPSGHAVPPTQFWTYLLPEIIFLC